MAELVTIEPENAADDVVATIERALQLAKEGRISSVAIAIVQRDGVGHSIWSAAPMSLAMLGAIRRLEHNFNADLDQRGTGPTAA